MGVARIITLDNPYREIDNSFSKLRLENLHASYQSSRSSSPWWIRRHRTRRRLSGYGAVDRNKFYAGSIQKPLALLYKERDYSRTSQNAEETNITAMKLLGDVTGKDVFMADDLLGTGGTVIKAMQTLKSFGAKRIICAVSLPLFSGDAIERFDKAYKEGLFYRLIGTNGVYNPPELLAKEWYLCANVSNLFARIISNLHHGRSASKLLDNRVIIQKLVTGQTSRHSEKE
jgi:ribose-phosphate pyrophosphokinase